MKKIHRQIYIFAAITLMNILSSSLFAAAISYSYDENNRLTKVTYPNNRTITFSYDANGNMTKVVSTDTAASGPIISTQPVYRPVEKGDTLSLSVTAAGTGLTYQWYKDGVALTNGGDISGADTATLSVASLDTDNEGVYYCIVTDGSGGTATTVDLNVYVLDSGTSDLWKSMSQLAPGSTFTIYNFEVDAQNGDFQKKPKVTGELVEPVKGKYKTYSIKTINPFPSEDITAYWSKPVTLYDKKQFKTYYKSGYSCDDFLYSVPQMDKNTYIKVQVKGGSLQYLDRMFTIVPPKITDVKNSDESSSITSATPGDTIVLIGKYFGEKAPKVWIEYNITGKAEKKQLKLKVLKDFVYTNSKGKAASSCMNLPTGTSKLKVLIPEKTPKGLIKGSNNIVIDNKQGLATYSFELQ